MLAVDRGNYTALGTADSASYGDNPLRIGWNVTISAPHMHAMCLDLLEPYLQPGMRCLDLGSGSGYLTAAMANLVAPTGGKAVGVEHIRELHEQSVQNVAKADSHLVKSDALALHCADGFTGWPDGAPYDCIHIGAAAPNAKSLETVLGQLASGGVLISPVGPDGGDQELVKFTRGEDEKIAQTSLMGVCYVPFTCRKKQLGE